MKVHRCDNYEGLQPESCFFNQAPETVPCEACRGVVAVADAKSVDDFYLCPACLKKEAKP